MLLQRSQKDRESRRDWIGLRKKVLGFVCLSVCSVHAASFAAAKRPVTLARPDRADADAAAAVRAAAAARRRIGAQPEIVERRRRVHRAGHREQGTATVLLVADWPSADAVRLAVLCAKGKEGD